LATHHSFTCPYCSRLGYTDIGLLEHVDEEHGDETKDVVSADAFVLLKVLGYILPLRTKFCTVCICVYRASSRIFHKKITFVNVALNTRPNKKVCGILTILHI